MPRFFFNVRDGREIPDQEGTELPDRAAVRDTALRYAGELLHDGTGEFWTGDGWRLDVTDMTGAHVLTFRFSAEEHGTTR